MKILFITLALFLSALIIYFFALGFHSKSKTAPKLINGQLTNCPSTPNCVCSEYKDQSHHYIRPIKILDKMPSSFDSLLSLKDIVQKMGGEIKTEKENYFSATFTSSIFRFVDDLEIRIDTAKSIIHLRSASRVGKSDLGANRKRVQLIKKLYEALKMRSS